MPASLSEGRCFSIRMISLLHGRLGDILLMVVPPTLSPCRPPTVVSAPAHQRKCAGAWLRDKLPRSHFQPLVFLLIYLGRPANTRASSTRSSQPGSITAVEKERAFSSTAFAAQAHPQAAAVSMAQTRWTRGALVVFLLLAAGVTLSLGAPAPNRRSPPRPPPRPGE